VLPSTGQQTVLPVSGDTPLDLGTPAEGKFEYVCGMGMYSGHITFTTPAPGKAPSGPTVQGPAASPPTAAS
jgi:plastocyanin domain-containing protein